MNLAYRDVRHKLGRFVLTCLGLSLLLGVVLSMIGIYRGLVDDALVLARTPGAQLWVVETGTRGPFAESCNVLGPCPDWHILPPLQSCGAARERVMESSVYQAAP